MKTFLFQGDSITDANRDDEGIVNAGLGCGYAFFLASEFEKKHKGAFRFINRGDSGDRITDVYARIKEDIINLKPDIMSILIGINDFDFGQAFLDFINQHFIDHSEFFRTDTALHGKLMRNIIDSYEDRHYIGL